jgi:hypothetical protein
MRLFVLLLMPFSRLWFKKLFAAIRTDSEKTDEDFV